MRRKRQQQHQSPPRSGAGVLLLQQQQQMRQSWVQLATACWQVLIRVMLLLPQGVQQGRGLVAVAAGGVPAGHRLQRQAQRMLLPAWTLMQVRQHRSRMVVRVQLGTQQVVLPPGVAAAALPAGPGAHRQLLLMMIQQQQQQQMHSWRRSLLLQLRPGRRLSWMLLWRRRRRG